MKKKPSEIFEYPPMPEDKPKSKEDWEDNHEKYFLTYLDKYNKKEIGFSDWLDLEQEFIRYEKKKSEEEALKAGSQLAVVSYNKAKEELKKEMNDKLSKYLKLQGKDKNGMIQVPECEIDQILL